MQQGRTEEEEGEGEGDDLLHCNYCGYKELPEKILKNMAFRKLKKIYLKWNRLTSLPAGLGVLSALSELYIQGNKLTSLPTDIGTVAQLTILDVSGNQLTELPPSISQLSKLKKLQISRNCFSLLPKVIGRLPSLVTLECDRNNLGHLPLELMNCRKLELLSLDKNNLQEVPKSLCRLDNLEELSLTGNDLIMLPYGVVGMASLQFLYVDNNPHLLHLPNRLHQRMDLVLGYLGCGTEPVPPSRLASCRSIPSRSTSPPYRIALPPEICQVLDKTDSVPSLMELCLRKAYSWACCGTPRSTDDDTSDGGELPTHLKDILNDVPTGQCCICERNFFTACFPWLESADGEEEKKPLYRLSLSCSVNCYYAHEYCRLAFL